MDGLVPPATPQSRDQESSASNSKNAFIGPILPDTAGSSSAANVMGPTVHQTPTGGGRGAAELRFKRLKGCLRTLRTLGDGAWVDIEINGTKFQYLLDETKHFGVSSMGQTFHFCVRGRESHKLYWYEQFAAVMTPMHTYIEFCGLSNGDVCVGVWETRCNRPFHALLIYRKGKKVCELITTHNFRHIFPGVFFDPAVEFDMDEVVK